MMGLGAVVLTDLVTGELRAPSNFKSVLGRETVMPCQLTPAFTLCCSRHTYTRQIYGFI